MVVSLGVGAMFLLACSPQSAPPPEVAPAPAPPEPKAEEAPKEEAPVPVPVETPAPEPPADPPPKVVEGICAEGCKKVATACSERAASFCEASCRDYVSGADKCPAEIRDALTCQQNADDFLLCSNIAAESCAPLYKKMQDCRDGKVPPRAWEEVAQVVAKENIPVGFGRRGIESFGFSHFVPQGAPLEAGAASAFKVQASDSAGFLYIVESVQGDGKPKQTDASILRTATKYVGRECEPKLRLHGRYDTQGVIHTRFDTVCADGTQIRGMLHFWEGLVVAASARSSTAQDNPHLEPFLFSFERSAAPASQEAAGK